MDALTGNGIVLDRTVPFERRIARLIEHCGSAADEPVLVDGVAFFLLYCWFQRHTTDAAALRGLIDASLAGIGGELGWIGMLHQRGYCACGQTNRLENMTICVECASYECWECYGCHRARTGHEVVG
ncbi:hypothetical protein Afil01_65560 [Actinorhabdospora filicis]|uniref:Uncharacterized protein n=1 Tax=Actinorhabdospora filicis TaxID=1785913 RepID=A0A9W6SRU4_9ACTN|nr:hypothetical protein [Actinorhabdospora filicis]GLZ81749.1 hypothetical protein Afil01_65560 [Actinorhabdospora filicis]